MHNTLLSLFLITSLCTCGRAQSFSAFSGDLLKIEEKAFRYGFDHYPDMMEVLGQISFPALDFLPRETEVNFPGVTLPSAFGFLLSSTLTVDTAGCHVFTLASDDGSRLWISDSLVINNGGPHQWRVKRDTSWFEPGAFPVRVWYFNAYIPLMGLALKAERLPNGNLCALPPVSLPAATLFEADQSRLRPGAIAGLNVFAARLAGRRSGKVIVTGHTDADGPPEYNQRLSLRRAEAVAGFLREKLGESSLEFVVIGMGEEQPLSKVKAENRRVEIRVE
ncbi:OmpA family protein [Neolewinella aurantiaca]|uniref:OmpA family protein n=1 Tax=Neolewinella aurantiaca TaxID=2602767 RepID=A0A5C7FH00_9BACT|nr:OmpA family protein [Neolewinella aurantiaca]TXF88917.1 OmpA family protein [Neolewinella aurantiaca]